VEKKVPSDIDPDEVKALVVRGFSIENAIMQLVSPPASSPDRPLTQSKTGTEGEAASMEASADVIALRQQNQQLSEQVKTLRAYVDELKSGLQEKEASLRIAGSKLDRLRDKTAKEIKRQHEIRIRDKEIERLRSVLRSERKHIKKLKKSLERQKKMEAIEETRGLVKLKPLSAFTREAVLQAAGQFGLENGDLAYLEDASGGGKSTVELLQERGIAGVVVEDEMSATLTDHFFDLGIAVFKSQSLPVQKINSLPFVRPEDLSAAWEDWQKEMEARQAKKETEKLESIFEEYRVERKREEKRKQKLAKETKALKDQ